MDSTEKTEPAKAKKAASKQPEIDFNDKRAVAEQYMPYVRSIAGKVKKKVS